MKTFDSLKSSPLVIVLASAVLLGAAGALLPSALPQGHVAQVDLTVDHLEAESPEDYGYDGYYALRAQEVFADVVVGWLHSPSVHARVRELAGPTADAEHGGLPEELRFAVKKVSPATVAIAVRDEDPGRAELVARTATGVVSGMAKETLQDAEGLPTFEVTGSSPVVEARRLAPIRSGIVGALLGAIVAAIAVFLVTPPKRR